MKKKFWILLCAIPIVLIILILLLPVVISGIMWLAYPAPATPDVQYGEFPFELVYEIDGEIVTVNDVYVCEYKGIEFNEAGKFRDWDGYIKSTGKANLTLCEDEVRKVCCSVGSSGYYMGEWKQKEPPTPYVFEVIHDSYDFDERMKLWIHSEKELMEQYNIKLISWKFSEPIENTFE